MLQISQAALDLIVNEEVGGPAVYTKLYQRPEWPGGASGITIGIGYDCGYQNAAGIVDDWQGLIPPEQVLALTSCAGKKGVAAHSMLSWIRPQVLVPLDEAMKVFNLKDMPRWINATDNALPNCDLLPPDCFGALVSLSYNRGCSYDLNGSRYVEMNNIKQHMLMKQFDKIPQEFRSMKRLWNNGLVGRREREAQLFEHGLASMNGLKTVTLKSHRDEVRRDAYYLAGGSGLSVMIGAVTSNAAHDLTFYSVVAAASALCALTGWALIKTICRFKRSPKADP
jgi:hypothetical protein